VQSGRRYFFHDGVRAFTDRHRRLTTPSENTQVIADLMAIAQARHWQRVAVSGTERFRKQAWLAAQAVGLEVIGYRQDAFDRARAVRAEARCESPAPATKSDGQRGDDGRSRVTVNARRGREPDRAKEDRSRRHAGRLVDHGPAPYRHDPHQPMSYFVKLETSRGDRELWGVDLERAIRQSLSRPQIGDDIVVRAVRQEPVTVRAQRRDEAGKIVEVPLTTHRNRWSVEKQSLIEERQAAASALRDPTIGPTQGSREHPELIGAYLQVHAAELAAKQLRDPQDREHFVALVRRALAEDVGRGEPLPVVRVQSTSREAARGESTRVSRTPDGQDGSVVRRSHAVTR
jgi:putative DNA primase/helicase